AFGGGNKGGEKKHFKKIMQQLDLSDEQKTKLKSFKEENKGDKPKKGELKELNEKLQTGFLNNASDSELKDIHNQIKALKTSRMDKRFNHMMNIKSVLNDVQRKKFFELKEQMRSNRKDK